MIKIHTILSITLLFVIIAAISYFLFRKKRHQWYIRRARQIYHRINASESSYSPAQLMTYLRHINPYVFEELLLYAFQCKGYKTIHNLRYSGDGGIDGQVVIDGKRIPIQAKRYSSYIRHEHVAAFARIITLRRKPYGLFIHTGRTGKKGYEPSSEIVRIISGEQLLNLLYKNRPFHILQSHTPKY